MIKKTALLLIYLLVTVTSAWGQLRLPQFVSDGMVLQRDSDVTVWGWASPEDTITLKFKGETYSSKADGGGNWSIDLDRQVAGGPFTMQISASNDDTIKLQNILVGDVWVGSGQSNMELPMSRVSPLYEEEIRNAYDPLIRYFEVPKEFDFKMSRTDLAYGQWQETTPETVQDFSAVAYFFAKRIVETYDVPVGIILSALGGSPAEAWLSEEALKEFPDHFAEAQRFKNDALIDSIRQSESNRTDNWYGELNQSDSGLTSGERTWHDPSTNTDDWNSMMIPGYWADTETGYVNGAVWFKKEIELSEQWENTPAKLEMGRIVDADSLFVNGQFVGNTTYQYPPRRYSVPAGILKEGENTISIRVINSGGRGGFIPNKPYELTARGDTVSLEGEWKYNVGTTMDPLPGQTFIRWKPLGLYNAMIHPLLRYDVKGVIWYQGESNADSPDEYTELFPALINDWRDNWQQDELPFLFVQLANFMEARDEPSESGWAELREAQRKTLDLPNTGMAVTIDIGEWNDIHPLNKKDVGERLAASALAVAYHEDGVVQAGPLFESVAVDKNKLILRFEHTGGGLEAKGDSLQSFALAGPDGQYRWAEAKIEGERVVVWHPDINNPVSVRYAWANNPVNANLYNAEGFPASPFQASVD